MTQKSVYVAGKVGKDLTVVKAVNARLQDMGYAITYDLSSERGIRKPYLNHVETNRPYAMKMRNAATTCDVFVLLVGEDMLDTAIVLGIAIGTSMTYPDKQVYIVSSQDMRQSIFYTLPNVHLVGTVQDLYEALTL